MSEEAKSKKLKPLKAMAYLELRNGSNDLIDNVTRLLFPQNFFADIIKPPININDSVVIRARPYNIRLDYTSDQIKSKINKDELAIRIVSPTWEMLFTLRCNDFRDIQIKYQDYLEPEITKKVIEIQNCLDRIVQDISIFKEGKFKIDIGEIIENLLKAAKLAQEIIN